MAGEETPGATPATENKEPSSTPGQQSPPQTPEGFAVTFKSKDEYEQLQKDAARTRGVQSNADRNKRFGGNKKKLEVQDEALSNQELLDARTKVTNRVLVTKEYQALTASNPELAKILTTRPWDLLDTDEFIDSDDLANQVLDYLDERVKSSASSTPAPSSTPEPPAPLPTQPSNDGEPPAQHPDEEAAEKRRAGMKPTERIEDKIKGKLKFE